MVEKFTSQKNQPISIPNWIHLTAPIWYGRRRRPTRKPKLSGSSKPRQTRNREKNGNGKRKNVKRRNKNGVRTLSPNWPKFTQKAKALKYLIQRLRAGSSAKSCATTLLPVPHSDSPKC